MAEVGQTFTNTLHKYISKYVKNFLKVTPSLYNFFQSNGLIRNINLGQDAMVYFDEKEPDGAQMASSIHDANVITPEFGETKVGLLYLAGRVRISLQDYQKFRTNQFVGGDLIQRTIQSALRVIRNQVDQFLAWGDDMKNPVKALDPFKGKGEFTGIFNGGTAVTAGIGGDNDVTAAGDYLATVSRARKALLSAGHESDKYMLLSDLDTQFYSTIGNNFYSNIGVTEEMRVRELPYIQDWLASPNFIDYAQTAYRMALISPRTRTGGNPNDTRPNFELIQSFPFYVHAEHAGGTNNGYYEYLLIWSGALVEYHSTAIQRTATLTLT